MYLLGMAGKFNNTLFKSIASKTILRKGETVYSMTGAIVLIIRSGWNKLADSCTVYILHEAMVYNSW